MARADGPILITGAAGFLGAWLIVELLGRGHRVVAADLNPDPRLFQMVARATGRAGGNDREVAWPRLDITDATAVQDLVERTGPRRVVHLAGMLIPGCKANPLAGAMVNIAGHINVIEAARAHGIDHVIYTSSMAAKPRGPANAPANLYGVYKKTGEEFCRIQFADHGLSSFGLRPHIVYGVGREAGETAAFSLAMQAAAAGRAYELPYQTATCFQYAGDLARDLAQLVETDWTGAFVSDVSDVVETTSDVAAAIAAAEPSAAITIAPATRISPVDGFDLEPLRTVVGELKRTPLADGTRQTIEAFRRLQSAA